MKTLLLVGLWSHALAVTAYASRSTHFSQVFYMFGTNTSGDITIKNLSTINQTVCVTGGAYERKAGAILNAVGSPVCPVFILDKQSGATERIVPSESNCIELNPNAMANWNVRRQQSSLACMTLDSGILTFDIKVLEDRGAVLGSVFITQMGIAQSTQGYIPVNGGRPF